MDSFAIGFLGDYEILSPNQVAEIPFKSNAMDPVIHFIGVHSTLSVELSVTCLMYHI